MSNYAPCEICGSLKRPGVEYREHLDACRELRRKELLLAKAERMEDALRQIRRYYGHMAINADTATLAVFIDDAMRDE